jgi:hypothetical protein
MKRPRKDTNNNEGTKDIHQLRRRDKGNTPTAKMGPSKYTNNNEGTKEHTHCKEATKETL